MQTAAIVLAAGAGTRMKSKKPKVAHKVLGKPLVNWVLDAARDAGVDRSIVVVGHLREQVEPLVADRAEVVVQPDRKGTADAVAVCAPTLAGFEGSVLVLNGDCPLISSETIRELVRTREERKAACVFLTMELDDPLGYGRIVRDEAGEVRAIVEQKDASDDEQLIQECNAGFYCFDAEQLFAKLSQVNANNAAGEYYLTDVVELLVASGATVIGMPTNNPHECLGVNSRAQLAQATKVAQQFINSVHMANGVTMIDPDQVWIGPDVRIEPDVELLPQVMLMGNTTVGEDCVIGPNSRLTDTVVGCGVRIDETVAIEAIIDDGAECGPRAYLRSGTHLCEGSKAGTHVEIKKSTIGAGSKVPHLSYIGDTTMGAGVNIGAGSITCNYDGKRKNPTTIGDDVFVGSDTMMVAPVSIGDGALIGAGSVITEDVPSDALGIARAKEVLVEGWAKRHREQ